MTNRIIGAAVACVLSVSATAAFAQQGAGGSGSMTTTQGGSGSGGLVSLGGTLTLSNPLHGQPPTSPPQMARPPRLQTPQPERQTPKVAMPPPQFGGHFDNPNGPQAFSVVLVVGEMEGTPAADNVPAAARKALTDLKDFLPYKNYRLLDSQWTLCCGRGAIFSRLRGLDEQEYELQLTPTVTPTIRNGVETRQSVVNVRFVLTEAGSSAPKAAINRFATSRGHRQVIDASFRMDVGETVVVGTSRIQGDKALIALLTAVPPKSSAGR